MSPLSVAGIQLTVSLHLAVAAVVRLVRAAVSKVEAEEEEEVALVAVVLGLARLLRKRRSYDKLLRRVLYWPQDLK